MSLNRKLQVSLQERGFSRRDLGRVASLIAGVAAPSFGEFAMAQQAERRTLSHAGLKAWDPELVRLNSNENPLGPCPEGLEAMARVGPYGGRYSPFNEHGEFINLVAQMESVPEDHVAPYAGSGDPMLRASCAFTSPTRSWVMANPGYGGGAPNFIGSKTTHVPLRPDYSHNVQAMLQMDATAGAYYICNPNNPTGTVTPRKDIEYLLARKRKDAVVIVDEAYIHYTEKAQPCNDLVAAGKDIIVLRSFSKLYGMAGIRAGYALGRPDLLVKMRPYGVSYLPITGLACATASLRVPGLIAERRAINARVRENTFEFLEKKRIKFIPSEASFFMMDPGLPAAEFAKKMAKEKVILGRIWPVWPTKVRVSVGTQEEMDKFKAACEKACACC